MPTVIAETDELLVIDKPAGLIVHSDGRTEEPSVAEWILQKYPELADVGEAWVSPQGERIPLPGIVHRLDRTTSGVMLIAKTTEAYMYLKKEFKERRIEKIYRAFVHRHVEAGSGKIVAEIMRSKEPPKRWYARACDESDIRAAITQWKLLENFDDVAYVEIYPLTGRTHQIRVHFASIGHPLIGDERYGGKSKLEFVRPALHASSIALMLKGEKEIFVAPLSVDFQKVVVRL